jgi:hypothetical protein
LAGLDFFASPFGARANDPIKGEVKAITDGGFVRLLFHFDEAVESSVRVSGAIIVVNFKKPVAVAVEKLSAGTSGLISVARRDPDGGAIRIALAQKAKVNTIAAAERLYIDLLPENWNGPTPGLPQGSSTSLCAARARLKASFTSRKLPTSKRSRHRSE